MAQVKKLMIQGIRSFDPANTQVIEFYSPMTLIVGQNGCGKTTVIEALKFAITSEYPPGSSKGQTFVHDPKLSAGYEVGAIVKLELEEKNGGRAIITRRVKAVQKGKTGNVSVQMLEGTIRRNKDGKKVDMSSKCADMKSEMSRMMGVSDAILNNVIFCHQEDSCWPLTEGKKVKEKFDAIFNTTMYMKALDELAKKDKEVMNSIKVYEARLHGSTELMKEKKSKTRKIDQLAIELTASTDMITKQEKEYKEISAKLREFQELEQEYAKVSNAVTQAKTIIEEMQKTIAETTRNITQPLCGTLPELMVQMAKFKEAGNEQRRRSIDLKAKFEQKEKEWNHLNAQKEKYLTEEGVFKQQETQNTARVATLKKMITEILSVVRRMKDNSQESNFTQSVETVIETFEDDANSTRPELLVRSLLSAIKAKDSENNKIQNEFAEKEKEVQTKLNNLTKSKSSLQTEIKLKNESIEENKESVKDLKQRLIVIEGSTDALALLEDDEKRYTEIIDGIQKGGMITKYEQEIQIFNEDILKLEKRRAKLAQDIQLLRADKSIMDEIEMHNRQKLTKKEECNRVKRQIEDQIQNILEDFPENNLSQPLEKKLKALANEVKAKETEVKNKHQELTKQEADQRQVVQELQKKEKSAQEWKEQIDELLDGSEFETACEEATDKLDEAQKENYYNDAAQYLYKKYIQKLKSKRSGCPSCPLCKRNFNEQAQANDLMEELRGEVEKLQTNGPADKIKIEGLKERQQTLTKLKPRWEDLKKLETEIPVLKRRRNSLEESIRGLKERVEEGTDSLDLLKNDLNQGNALVKDAAHYDQYLADMKKSEQNIQACERKRNSSAKDCGLSLSEAESERQGIEGTISAKRLEKDTKEVMRNSKRDEFASTQEKRNGVKEEKLRITSEMQNREALETQKRTLEEGTKELQTIVVELNRKIPTLTNDIETWESKKAELIAEKESTLEKLREEKGQLEQHRRKLAEINTAIDDFEKVIKHKYADKKKQIAQHKERLDECDTSKKELSEEIDILKTEMSSHETIKRNLEDHISVKNKEADVKKWREELGTKEATLAAATNRGVTTERKELSARYENILRSVNLHKGSKIEIQKSLVGLKKEVGESPFKNLEAEHCENLVHKTVYSKALKDIRLYRTALDSAIMKFHHKKMEKINQYLKYFWKKIYKGNDIDFIQIKTDNEDPLKSESTVKVGAKKKVYNYRVVMMRMGVELDMRGRCSAGQKVLASIIIRMALAQTFSAKCGIITLDEPTTNLDKRNIDSLAETLSQIANEMKEMKTFQLVIITHDQDFINKLLMGDPADYYFKVSRDKGGFSQIDRINR